MQGVSQASKALDAFVIMHSVCAIGFASAMLFMPSLFVLFINEDEFPPLAGDAIRWASPFVYGFGILAALSVTMHGEDRFKIACMYVACLGMAVPVGCFVQSS